MNSTFLKTSKTAATESAIDGAHCAATTDHTSQHELHVENGIELALPDLRKRALSLTRNLVSAEDLVQDSIERALKFKSSYRVGGHLRAWLFRIMYNVFVSQRRRSATERRVLERASADPNGWITLVPARVTPGLSPPVEHALGDLPQRMRAAIQLVDLEESSYLGAAEKEGVPVGTIMSRLSRGRLRLAHALSEPAVA